MESVEGVNGAVAEAAWGRGDWETVDRLVSADYVSHGCFGEESREDFKVRVAEFRTAFPDLNRRQDVRLAIEYMVITALTLTGTHLGVFRGVAPTGRAVTFSGIVIDRIVDAKRVESWVQYDLLGLLTQIGAPPAAEV